MNYYGFAMIEVGLCCSLAVLQACQQGCLMRRSSSSVTEYILLLDQLPAGGWLTIKRDFVACTYDARKPKQLLYVVQSPRPGQLVSVVWLVLIDA